MLLKESTHIQHFCYYYTGLQKWNLWCQIQQRPPVFWASLMKNTECVRAFLLATLRAQKLKTALNSIHQVLSRGTGIVVNSFYQKVGKPFFPSVAPVYDQNLGRMLDLRSNYSATHSGNTIITGSNSPNTQPPSATLTVVVNTDSHVAATGS